MSDPQVAIQANDLRRAFGTFVAVDGVNLTIPKGEIYGFLGPNGAGKSTTCRMLCTLTMPTGGRATVAGFDVATQPEQVRLRIGAALQATALDPQQTGTELLRQQGRYYGLRRKDIDRRIEQLRSLIDIGDALDQRIKTYSGGMKRRVDLAAALIHNPEVLFLDEPTTGLDPASRASVWEEVRRLNRDLGMTIFLTTQYLEEADALAGRVGIIDRGRIIAEDTPAALKRSIGADVITVTVDDPDRAASVVSAVPGIDAVEIRQKEVLASTADGAAAISPVAVALEREGISVLALSMRAPTLDDVFITLTGHHLQENAA